MASRRSSGGAATATPEERRLIDQAGDKLSDSVRRAKWIHGDERPDRKGQTLVTRDHDVIRRWAEERGGQPATATRGPDEEPRTLRFDFQDRDARLEPISWERWLRVFDERNLLFVYQEQKRDGNQSTFFRLESPER